MQTSPDAPSTKTPKSKLKKLVLIGAGVGAVVGIGIQFVPVEGIGKNPPERFKIDAPPEVEAILREACFDCHTNETRWPLYAKLAPGSWLLSRDVKKGRSRMNMSEWGDADEGERKTDKENAWDQIQEGNMPPWFYIYPFHMGAKLSDEQKAKLKAWMVPDKAK